MKILACLALVFLCFSLFASPAAAISFSLSNLQTQNDQVTFQVAISGLTSSNSCPNGHCYLQAAFTEINKTNYFGFTQDNSSQWYAYTSSPDTAYIQSSFFSFLPVSGAWSGNMTLRINVDDIGYKGSGDYTVKAWRYSGNTTSPAGPADNTLTASIIGPTPTPKPTPTPAPTAVPAATSTPAPTPTSVQSVASTPTPKPTSALTLKPTQEVAGQQETSSSAVLGTEVVPLVVPSPQAPGEKVAGWKTPTIAAGFVFAGLVCLGFSGYSFWRKFKDGRIKPL